MSSCLLYTYAAFLTNNAAYVCTFLINGNTDLSFQAASTQNQLKSLSRVVMDVNSRQDVNQFVTTNSSSVTYPPPRQVFTLPEPANPKLVSYLHSQIIIMTKTELKVKLKLRPRRDPLIFKMKKNVLVA